jgi:hypothetical protein
MDKLAQSRSIRNIISPLKYIGKKYLSSRSDIYKETLDVLIKADDIFRDVVRKQANYIKDMKKDKRRLEAVKFAQDVSAFLREQAVLIQIVNQMRNKFAEAVGVPPAQLKSIDYYISSEIGKTPEYNPNQRVEKGVDVEQQWEMERPSSIGRWFQYYTKSNDDWTRLEGEGDKVANELPSELISEAFLASWFWGKTESGKQLKKSFDVVFNSIVNLFNANLNTLKMLDKLRSQGDAQAYWDVAKGKNGFGNNYIRFIQTDSFSSAWNKFEKFMFESMKGEDVIEEDTEEDTNDFKKMRVEEDIGYEPPGFMEEDEQKYSD